jgi:hypothetical protein
MSQFKKTCTTCGKEIQLSNNTGAWKPYNLDNSPHRCLPSDRYSPKEPMVVENKQPQPQPLTLEALDQRLKRVEKILFNEQAAAGR